MNLLLHLSFPFIWKNHRVFIRFSNNIPHFRKFFFHPLKFPILYLQIFHQNIQFLFYNLNILALSPSLFLLQQSKNLPYHLNFNFSFFIRWILPTIMYSSSRSWFFRFRTIYSLNININICTNSLELWLWPWFVQEKNLIRGIIFRCV